jgi:transcriptional regulator with XRE-family HTH domain
MREPENLHPEAYKRRDQVAEDLKISYGNYQQMVSVLRLTRELYGLHQKQAAAIMGMTQSAISKLEMGLSDPSFYTFVKYAAILGRDMKIFIRAGDEDEVSLFHILRHEIARTLPSNLGHAIESPILDLEGYDMNHKAADIIRCLAEIRAKREKGLSFWAETYLVAYKKPPTPEIVPDLSIKQMAEDLCVSHMTIRRFEKGEASAVTTSMVFRYADKLNLWLSFCKDESKNEKEPWEQFVSTCTTLHATAEMILGKKTI